MTMPQVQGRTKTAGDSVPKPVLALVFATGAWLIVGVVWLGVLRTLSLLGL